MYIYIYIYIYIYNNCYLIIKDKYKNEIAV